MIVLGAAVLLLDAAVVLAFAARAARAMLAGPRPRCR